MFSIFRSKRTPQFPAETDIHTHLVPGIDDGCPTVDHSLALLRQMSTWGIRRVIPTPHHTDDTFENTPATIDPPYNELLRAAGEASIPVDILPPSGEYRIDPYLDRLLRQNLVRPLPAGWILIENPFMQEPWDLHDFIYDLTQRGYRPILAHPERYTYYHRNLSHLNRLHDHIHFQVNILSLAGYYGNDIRHAARHLLHHDLIDFIATDIHHQRHADAIHQYLTGRQGHDLTLQLRPRILNDTL